MKSNVLKSAALALAVGHSSAASANLKPGQYDVGGLEQICLVNDGTWYSPTFPSWHGLWQIVGNEDKAIIFGHFDDGLGDVGEDSMILEKGGLDWTEWPDDFSYTLFLDDTPITRVKKTCDAKAPAQHGRLMRRSPMR